MIGQLRRIQYLDEAHRRILSHADVWVTSAEEIADYYLAHYCDGAPEHLAGLDAAEGTADREDVTNGAGN